MSPSRAAKTLAHGLAADAFFCDLLANLRLHLEHEVDLERVVEIRGFAIFRVLRRLWIPLVILVVIGAGGLTVSRLHGIFGSEKRPSYADTRIDTKPFNPKHLRYEIFGPPGTVADISYFDVNADPQHVDGVQLPWSMEITTNRGHERGEHRGTG